MKETYIKFRCSIEDKNIIQARAKSAGYGLSEYCRRQSLTGEIKQKPELSDEDKLYLRYLINHNSNFIKISNFIKYQDPNLCREIDLFLKKLKPLIHKLFYR